MEKKVLAIFSHPDDAEIMCAGTLSILKKKGWEIHIATMAPGDKGTAVNTREEISAIRKAEAKEAAELIGASYHCLEFEDVYILYERVTINAVTTLLRIVKPSIVFTASPQDYMVDHEMTSKIVLTACFSCGIRNMEVCEEPFEPVPFLYYSDPMEGKDKFGDPVVPKMYVDITEEMPVKEKMLGCHASQRNWLLEHHKMDEYILAMKRFSASRGEEINTTYAEGFRQHLGHGFNQENVLQEILGDKLIIK
jgi:LmbE family N-acetylglucosaminyl deacetylase